ncbi:MAG: GGDEF domain-containing protein [Clostridia bacterium]|nr:GGDEF domain-containing protein [Clostridia bacterium]
MVTTLYLEINATCIFILSLILYKMHVNSGKSRNKHLFSYVVTNALILCLLDSLWALLEGGILALPRSANYILNFLYLFQAGHLSYSWYLFSEVTLDLPTFRNKVKHYVALLPITLLFILCFSSLWNGWIFYIDGSNTYHRGPLFILQPIIAYSYILYSAAKALIVGFLEKSHLKKLECRTVASFIILPLFFGLIQFFNQQIPTLCVGISLSFLIVFISFQERQISLDPLTGLNNRFRFHKYLESRINNSNDKHQLYLLMLDIDSFKKINDTYGHVEGDEALKIVADTLRKACGIHNCFISRYGGDEFVIVYECQSEKNICDMKNQITDTLNFLNDQAKKTYHISISIGYAVYMPDMTSSIDLVEKADGKLYEIKQERKKKGL